MAKISISKLTQALPFAPTNILTHSRKHERDVTFKWRHSVGSFTSYPFQSWYDVGKG